MRTSLMVVLIAVSCSFSEAWELQFGARLAGDKKLYSWRLEAGPYQEAQDIKLFFEYSTKDVLIGREYLTMIELARPDDLIPNYFEAIELNSTYLFMIPVRRSVTEYWLEGNLYGLDGPPYPDG